MSKRSHKPTPPLTPQNLQSLIAIERQTRAERCLAEVQAALAPILKKHNCQVVATPQIAADGRLMASWGVLPLADGGAPPPN